MSDTMVSAPPIFRRTLHDEVVDRMRDMIVEGQLPAGDRINESELCVRLGVSRTPIREAVKTLASERDAREARKTDRNLLMRMRVLFSTLACLVFENADLHVLTRN